jgi:hypothetical protein
MRPSPKKPKTELESALGRIDKSQKSLPIKPKMQMEMEETSDKYKQYLKSGFKKTLSSK